MIMHGKKPVDTIWVHCSATRPDWMADNTLAEKVAEIRRWHMEPPSKEKGKRGGLGASDIGYHWIIDRDGNVAKGRDEDKPGAHVAGHNTGSIGICLIGGHGSSENDQFSDHFTQEQDDALRILIAEIESRADIKRIRGHNEVAAKACPGFQVGRWFHSKPARKSPVESTTVQMSATQIAAGVGTGLTAISSLHGTAQIVALALAAVIILAGAVVMRKRLVQWAAGRR